MNARERETGEGLSFPLCLPLSLPSEMDEGGSILKSDASESDRLTFAFQCDCLWRVEIGS